MSKIDALFDALLARKGSDLHLGVGYPPLIRERGELVALRDQILTKDELEEMLFEINTPAQKTTITDDL
ncbi:MAG TPA: type IV pili twitching motility protein PilT, partial [Polyangiaceae bacterium]